VTSLLFMCILAGCKSASASTSQYLGDISAIMAHGIIGRGVIKLENAINIDGSVVKRLRLINLARGEK
uniref:hypothetical protein n=2 Tax=Pseudomonadota TaxID=1224 RepID=UPI001952C587